MHNGYYSERDMLVEDGLYDSDDEIGFDFMEECDFFENPDIVEEINMFDFLHGYCDVFAVMLAEAFGYPLHAVLGPGAVIHAYCMVDGCYIDVRGITDGAHEFWDEFGYIDEPENVQMFESIEDFQETMLEYGMEDVCPYSEAQLRMLQVDPVFLRTYDIRNF